MLVISRKTTEAIMIDDNIEIVVMEVSKDKIKLGINAPKEIKVKRKEVYVTEEANKVASKSISREMLERMFDTKKGSASNGN